MKLDNLKEMFADTLNIGVDSFDESTASTETLESWDSLNHFRLITAIEETYKISLTMSEINEMTSYAKIVECLSEK